MLLLTPNLLQVVDNIANLYWYKLKKEAVSSLIYGLQILSLLLTRWCIQECVFFFFLPSFLVFSFFRVSQINCYTFHHHHTYTDLCYPEANCITCTSWNNIFNLFKVFVIKFPFEVFVGVSCNISLSSFCHLLRERKHFH